jgi:dTDP-4-amino-4,6-dideoxygalactose transaminase
MKKFFVTRTSMPPMNEYIDKIKTLWTTRRLTNMGEFHKELESNLRQFLSIDHVSLIVNGHTALELAMQSMDLPKGKEIITTPFTFISTTNAIIRSGYIPVFCDIKFSNYTIDEEKIESLINENTVAIVPVHVYGQVCNVQKIFEIANRYNLKVIYDAAHAFGVRYKGSGIATFGDAATFSFHATKVFNTIEGGCVAFSDKSLYKKLLNLKNFGITSEEIVECIGTNAKMNEFSAIMGLCNLNHINEYIAKRKEIVKVYRTLLNDVNGIRILPENDDVQENYSYFPILIDEEKFGFNRNYVYDFLKSKSVYTRKYFYPLTCNHKCIASNYKAYNIPIAQYVSDRILVLPLYEGLEIESAKYIIGLLKSLIV